MKRIISIVLIVVSIGLIFGFFLMTPDYVDNNGQVKHYEDKQIAFDMNSSWNVYEYEDIIKTPFLSSSPSSLLLNPGSNSEYNYYNNSASYMENGTIYNTSSTNATDVVIVKTEITKHDSLPNGISLENAYQSDSLYGLMSESGFSLINSTQMQVDGHNAYQFLYSVSHMIYQDTWIEDNGHYYRIYSQCPYNFYSNAEFSFNTIIDSFKIK